MSNFPAVFTVHTPQGPTHACVKHARAVENLFRFMGAHVNAIRAPDGAECANCINEAESAKAALAAPATSAQT